MLVLDKAQVKKILTAELGYDGVRADLYLRDYPPIHDELAGAVRRWLEDRTILDVSVFDVSIRDVMRLRGGHFLMAVRTLNRLLDSDLTPERRAQMVEDLRRPVYRW